MNLVVTCFGGMGEEIEYIVFVLEKLCPHPLPTSVSIEDKSKDLISSGSGPLNLALFILKVAWNERC